jgi:hypothetical protein
MCDIRVTVGETTMRRMSRREAMEAFGIFGLAAAVLPRELAAERTGQDQVILGDGKHRYEWIKGWLKLPEGVKLGSTHGCVEIDSKDNVLFNTDGAHAVIIVDPDGNFVKSIGKDFQGGAHGMTLAKEGEKEILFLSSLKRREIVKATLDGEVLMAIPYPEKAGVYKNKNEYAPTSVAVAPNGDIYVGDGYGKSWCHQWNAKGEYVRSWNEGKGGKMNQPHGIRVDTRGAEPTVVVADRGNGQLQIFALDAKPLAVVKEGLRMPCKVYIRGDLTVVPDLKGRITLLDKEYKLIAHLGENEDPKKQGNFGVQPADWKDGQFTAPHGAAIDSKGNVYVEDWNAVGRVSKLKKLEA